MEAKGLTPPSPMPASPGTVVRARSGSHYVVKADGGLRREFPKVRGKAARKADKRARRLALAATDIRPNTVTVLPGRVLGV